MKFKKVNQIVGDLKEKASDLNEQQKWQCVNFVWNGIPLPNSKAKRKLNYFLRKFNLSLEPLGNHYDRLIGLLEQILIEPIDDKEIKLLEKELVNFYKKPIIDEHKKYYGEYKNKVQHIFYPLDKKWIINCLLPDLKDCKQLQYTRTLKRCGLCT